MKVALSVLLARGCRWRRSAQPQRFNSDFSTMQDVEVRRRGGHGGDRRCRTGRTRRSLPMPGSQRDQRSAALPDHRGADRRRSRRRRRPSSRRARPAVAQIIGVAVLQEGFERPLVRLEVEALRGDPVVVVVGVAVALAGCRRSATPEIPCGLRAFMRDARMHSATKFVPVEPPTLRPSRRDMTRMAASDCASGTRIMRSIMLGMNEGSTLGRPMPSMREPRSQVAWQVAGGEGLEEAESSGSATQSRVACRL